MIRTNLVIWRMPVKNIIEYNTQSQIPLQPIPASVRVLAWKSIKCNIYIVFFIEQPKLFFKQTANLISESKPTTVDNAFEICKVESGRLEEQRPQQQQQQQQRQQEYCNLTIILDWCAITKFDSSYERHIHLWEYNIWFGHFRPSTLQIGCSFYNRQPNSFRVQIHFPSHTPTTNNNIQLIIIECANSRGSKITEYQQSAKRTSKDSVFQYAKRIIRNAKNNFITC